MLIARSPLIHFHTIRLHHLSHLTGPRAVILSLHRAGWLRLGYPWSRLENIAYGFVQAPPVCFVSLTWMVVCGCTATVLWGVASKICFKQHVAFLCSSHSAFSPSSHFRVRMMNPYSSTERVTAWKTSQFILSDKLDFCSISNLSKGFFTRKGKKWHLLKTQNWVLS